jgi:hypothetical protein
VTLAGRLATRADIPTLVPLMLELMATLAGRPLYEAAGFEPVEHLEDATGGAPVPLVRMRKPLWLSERWSEGVEGL